jgi:hypothetical protein
MTDYMRDDLKFGLDNENKLIDKFSEFFGCKLFKYTDTHSIFDFYSEDGNTIIELKSRKEPSTHYYFRRDIMVGENKIRDGVEKVRHDKNVFIVFSFSDGVVLYYKVNENSLNECNIRLGGRCDRGWDERRNTCFVPRSLCKIMD